MNRSVNKVGGRDRWVDNRIFYIILMIIFCFRNRRRGVWSCGVGGIKRFED